MEMVAVQTSVRSIAEKYRVVELSTLREEMTEVNLTDALVSKPGSSASLSLSRFVPGTGGHMVMRHRSATPSSLLIRPNLSNPKIHCQLLSNQQDNLVSLTLDILVSTQASCKHLMSMLASIGLRMGCQYFQSGVLKNLPYYLTCPATPPTPRAYWPWSCTT